MSNTLVSVIIPLFNREDLILETLESILNQTYKNWECIIVDDHSVDRSFFITEQFIECDKRFKLFLRPKSIKKGASSCRNYGYIKSKGDYIQWFDSDDIMMRNMLSIKVSRLASYDNYAFAACNFSIIDIYGESIDFVKKPYIPHISVIENILMYNFSFGTPIPLWRRSVIESELKLFDTRFTQSEDLEYYSRLLLRNSKYVFINKNLFKVRKHINSISSDTNKSYISKNIRDVVQVYGLIQKRFLLSSITNIFLKNELIRNLKISIYNKDKLTALIIYNNLNSFNVTKISKFKLVLVRILIPILTKVGKGAHKLGWLFKIDI